MLKRILTQKKIFQEHLQGTKGYYRPGDGHHPDCFRSGSRRLRLYRPVCRLILYPEEPGSCLFRLAANQSTLELKGAVLANGLSRNR